ncbi:MAG: hypothetical protein R6V57_14310 [Vicinamibacterales bacterium]
MASSFAFYAFVTIAAAGLVSMLRPVRLLRIRSRRAAAIVFLAGAVLAWRELHAPVLSDYVTAPSSKLDEFAPIYQFSERVSIPVRATADRIYDALLRVTAAEVPFYRTLVWIRRGGTSGPESVLNPPDHEPLIRVATRTTFLQLADVPGREFVMGAVVMAPEGVRLAAGQTPESFKGLTRAGFAKAVMSFSIEPQGPGLCLLRTDTRVHATDPVSRDAFAGYWRVIAPGSLLIRHMWLRAIKVRAEATTR